MKTFLLQRDLPKRALLVVVTLAAVAGVVTGRERPAIEVMDSKAPPAAVAAGLDADIDVAKLERPEASLPQSDPFARRSFGGPQLAAAAPQKPLAPPLPFQYIGKVIENGKREVYVARGDELLSIARGQKIGKDYRVDRITDSSITFTYLPLKMRQTLDLPALN